MRHVEFLFADDQKCSGGHCLIGEIMTVYAGAFDGEECIAGFDIAMVGGKTLDSGGFSVVGAAHSFGEVFGGNWFHFFSASLTKSRSSKGNFS